MTTISAPDSSINAFIYLPFAPITRETSPSGIKIMKSKLVEELGSVVLVLNYFKSVYISKSLFKRACKALYLASKEFPLRIRPFPAISGISKVSSKNKCSHLY